MPRSCLIFCALSLVLAAAVIVVAFPHSALSPKELAASKTPANAEDLPALDLGSFGVVSAADLVKYFIENPPVARPAEQGPDRKIRFQGC